LKTFWNNQKTFSLRKILFQIAMTEEIKNAGSDADLDAIDWALLAQLQTDASLSNVALAQAVHVSPPTCLRRVKRLHDLGLIERQVAILNTDAVAKLQGHGLTAVVEVVLDKQHQEALEAFEAHALADVGVQQCYRVSPAYQALSQRLFTAHANVRNVKAFFSVKRGKFQSKIPLAQY
jgi:DNA-binding Lrp family transcriptional regulator